MNKILLPTLCLCFSLAFSSSAWSLTVGSIDVGSLDTPMASADLGNSGDGVVLDWVKVVLGTDDITLDAKYTDMSWLQTNEAGTYAIDFQTDSPEYFLVKTGNISGSSFTHFLFLNNESFSWGVVNLSAQLGIQSITNVGKISHVDEFKTAAPVPEPATLLLLGSGLLGLAGFRKKSKN